MTAPARLDVFAPITKRERDPKTGHLYVYGKITGPDLDRDQQRMDSEWLKSAVPDWFTRGNIREGHDHRRAIGKAVELVEKDDGWYIGAKIVDRDAVEKIEEEVLTGFSIGIKGPRLDHTKADAPNGTITGGRICETSLVDVPCLSSAMISDHWAIPLAKADGSGELQPVEDPELVRTEANTFGLPVELYDRLTDPMKEALAALASTGAEVTADVAKTDDDDAPQLTVNVAVTADAASSVDTPVAAHPIKTKADLTKALAADDAFRTHILTRAQALGLEAMVPSNNPAETPQPVAQAADPETIAKAEEVLRTVRTLVPTLAKADNKAEDVVVEEPDSADAAGIDEAIACIARLIEVAAESLAQGDRREICDIGTLLDAARSLSWFADSKRWRAVEEEESGKADAPDASTPAAPAAPAVAVEPAPAPVPAPQTAEGDQPEADTTPEGAPAASEAPEDAAVTKADVAELVKAAIAEVTEATQERTKALEAELTKANAAIEEFRALPTAGGPALTRTAAQQAQARGGDADVLRRQAKELLSKAAAVSDRDLAAGYKERAVALLAKADA